MPVSADYKAPEPKRREFPPMPKGVYPGEILDIDIRKEKAMDSDEEVDKINFTWVILKDGDFYGRRVWFKATPTLGKKSKLKPVLETLLGRAFTEEECKKSNVTLAPDLLNSLVGLQKNLVLDIHTSGTGRQSNQIAAYLDVEGGPFPSFDESKVKKD